MQYEFPEYLRLHVADDVDWNPEHESDFELDCLCQAFTMATGWHLDYHSHGPTDDAVWSAQLPDARGGSPTTLQLSEPILGNDERTTTAVPSAPAVKNLAKELAQLVKRLHQAEKSLWEREAELAAAVPLVTRPEAEPARLAQRLEAILRGGAEAVEGTAAALYLLDDGTNHLKLRSQWGLAGARYSDPPRPLRTAKGDLEALAGQVVVLEDAAALPHWNIPFDFPAAVCIPVSTATIPLGTLWIFADHKRDYSGRETNLLEIVAGRIAVELEREVLLREHTAGHVGSHLSEAVAWQNTWLPHQAPDIAGWDIAATTSYEDSLNSELYHWSLDDQGRLHFSLCSAEGSGIATGFTAAQVSGVLSQLLPTGDPTGALRQVNQMLWNGSSGDRLASSWGATLQPSSGRLIGETAGNIFAFVIRPHGWETLARPATLLGSDDVVVSQRVDQVLYPGDILMVMTGPRRQKARNDNKDHSQAAQFAEVLLHHNHLSAKDMTHLVRSCWTPQNSQWKSPPALFVARFLD